MKYRGKKHWLCMYTLRNNTVNSDEALHSESQGDAPPVHKLGCSFCLRKILTLKLKQTNDAVEEGIQALIARWTSRFRLP
jgi:hypothetical protein